MTEPNWDNNSPDVLEAFRAVTGWSDEQVMHYLICDDCNPICGHEEYDCPESPNSKAIQAHMAARRAGEWLTVGEALKRLSRPGGSGVDHA